MAHNCLHILLSTSSCRFTSRLIGTCLLAVFERNCISSMRFVSDVIACCSANISSSCSTFCSLVAWDRLTSLSTAEVPARCNCLRENPAACCDIIITVNRSVSVNPGWTPAPFAQCVCRAIRRVCVATPRDDRCFVMPFIVRRCRISRKFSMFTAYRSICCNGEIRAESVWASENAQWHQKTTPAKAKCKSFFALYK